MTITDPTEPANLWPEIQADGIARLQWWQHRRHMDEAQRKEREMVQAALSKLPKDRTAQDNAAIAYSRWGTAAGCGC